MSTFYDKQTKKKKKTKNKIPKACERRMVTKYMRSLHFERKLTGYWKMLEELNMSLES